MIATLSFNPKSMAAHLPCYEALGIGSFEALHGVYRETTRQTIMPPQLTQLAFMRRIQK